MIIKSLLISRGGGPRTPCDATCGDKQMGEASRVLPVRHKSAEPIEAGRAGTSDPVSGSACKPTMARETEPMADASSEYGPRQLGSGRDGPRFASGTGGVSVRAGATRTGGARRAARQPRRVLAWRRGRSPHGVKSAPKAGQRSEAEPKNLVLASAVFGRRMAEATSDRLDEGRSLRSSPRAGKPLTRLIEARRREAVDTACWQEAGSGPAR